MSLYIYDDNINSFITLMKQELERLSNLTKNFYVKYLPILITEDNKKLGYYDREQNCIVLNKKLIYCAKLEIAKKILGHEVAHYLTCYDHGNVQSHGKEFKEICEKYDLFAPATADIDKLNNTCKNEREGELVEKVKKLLRLASSDNENESKLATAKANQLLMKYNLSLTNTSSNKIYMRKIGSFNKINAKASSIALILNKFNVFVVHYTTRSIEGQNSRYLQISGDKANVDIAEYVYNFLNNEFDRLWKIAKKQNNFKGTRAKNSYFCGLSKGFIDKLNQSKEYYTDSEHHSLITINKNIELISKKYIYKRLINTYSSRREDSHSKEAGYNDGQRLSINQGVNNNSEKRLLTR